MAEQVIVPNGTMIFPAGEASPTSTIVVSFAELVQLACGNASWRIALWDRAEVLCGKNTTHKGLQKGHNECPNAGLDKLRAHMKENLDSILADCSSDDIREVLANNRSWRGARAGQISSVDLVLPSGPTGMDPSQTSFFQSLGFETRMIGPDASEIGSRHRCSRGRSDGLHFLSHISGGGHIPSCVRHRCVHVELHQ